MNDAKTPENDKIELPAPTLPDFPDNTIDLKKLGDNLKVEFNYPEMAQGHTVKMRWRGIETHLSPLQTVREPGVLTFLIPSDTVKKDLDNKYKSKLSGSVGINNDPLIISPFLEVTVTDGEQKP